MIVKIEDVEIRGHEIKVSKSGKNEGKEYVIVRFEDVTGKAHEIIDRDVDNAEYYKRGTVGQLYADLDIGKSFTKFEVSRFVAEGTE